MVNMGITIRRLILTQMEHKNGQKEIEKKNK
jgi:hypothetical protein